MQHRYLGDIGDYGKYGLLRAVCRFMGCPMSVNWYLTYPENNKDGRHRDYLMPAAAPVFRPCDPDLYDWLIVLPGQLDVNLFQQSGLLPVSTHFYDAPLDMRHIAAYTPVQRAARVEARRQWFEDYVDHIPQQIPVAFFDPDNGLAEPVNLSLGATKARKYVFPCEIARALGAGVDVILYQHARQGVTVQDQVRNVTQQVMDAGAGRVIALRWNRVSVRSYLIIQRPESSLCWDAFVDAFLNSPWARHFSRL